LKAGDWVIYTRGLEKAGVIVDFDNVGGVFISEDGYTTIRHPEQYLTVVSKEVAEIFIAVHNHKEK